MLVSMLAFMMVVNG